jgi:hypothetical protein
LKYKAKSFVYNKRILARKKRDKDYTKSEKQLLISLINYYSLFEAHDNEVIRMLSKKIGKKISETLFLPLKERSNSKKRRFRTVD